MPQSEYYQQNKERLKQAARNWYNQNKNRAKASRRRYYRKNKNALKAAGKIWSAANPDKVAAYDLKKRRSLLGKARSRRWYEKNKDRVKRVASECIAKNPEAHNARVRVRRARLAGAVIEDCTNYIVALRLETKACRYCDKPLIPSDVTIDHVVPITRGGKHAKENLVGCCKSCNSSKGNKLLSEWTPPNARIQTSAA